MNFGYLLIFGALLVIGLAAAWGIAAIESKGAKGLLVDSSRRSWRGIRLASSESVWKPRCLSHRSGEEVSEPACITMPAVDNDQAAHRTRA